jgi:hypothetical protein
MRRDSVLLIREKLACMEQIRASIGQRLRHEYDDAQPLSDRLVALVRKIEHQTAVGNTKANGRRRT